MSYMAAGRHLSSPPVAAPAAAQGAAHAGAVMTIPEGHFDVPPGKIAAVVTSLEMLAAPVLPLDPEGGWILRRVAQPDPAWYRDLYARVGREWLWSQRARMSDAELAATIRAPGVEITTLEHDGGDEALLELDFRKQNEC